MTKREHEVEYLLTAQGLELFIIQIQEKVSALNNSKFRAEPQQPIATIREKPQVVWQANVGDKPQPPLKHSKKVFSFRAFWGDIIWCADEIWVNIVALIVLFAFSTLWFNIISGNPIVWQWQNPILLLFGGILICLAGLYSVLVGGDMNYNGGAYGVWQGIKSFIVGACGILALFGLTKPFLVILPTYYFIGIITGFAVSVKNNSSVQGTYESEYNNYKKQLKEWERVKAEVDRKKDIYRNKLDEYESNNRNDNENYKNQLIKYEKDKEQWHNDFNAWGIEKNHKVAEYNNVLEEAKKNLNALYASEKIIPKPYRYAQAVCYLYDFLSEASDEYDIKYALSRLDTSEIKNMLGTIMKNQQNQILLSIKQIEQLHTLHNDNINTQSAIYESGERITGSIQNMRDSLSKNIVDMGDSISSGISNMERVMSERMANISSSIQNDNKNTALLKDIAENSSAAANASAYLAAVENKGSPFPAQWKAQEFLIHNKKYL